MSDTKPMGYIPQVAHTNGFYDGYFGLLNDQGLGIAESTCSSRIVGATSRAAGGAGLWYTDELSRVAMERLDNAKEAVQLHGGMGVSEEMMIGHYLKKMISIDALFGNADYHLKKFAS